MLKIHNVETGEVKEFELTEQEIVKRADEALAYDTKKATEALQKQAILDRLGITADEARLLLS